MNTKTFFFPVTLFTSTWLSGQVSHQKNLEALIAAENKFAGLAETTNFRNGFLQNLDSTGVVFNGAEPVNGISFYKKLPDNNELLFKWYPVYAELAGTGDIGFTSGPYIIISNKNKDTIAGGKYFSIWKKNKEGIFKVLLDGGVNDTSYLSALFGKIQPATAAGTGKITAGNTPAGSKLFITAEKEFVELASIDLLKAYEKFMAKQAYLLRPDMVTGTNKITNLETLSKTNTKSRSFDKKGSYNTAGNSFYCNYGTAKMVNKVNGKDQKGYFVQIWQYQPEGWKIIADVLQPVE